MSVIRKTTKKEIISGNLHRFDIRLVFEDDNLIDGHIACRSLSSDKSMRNHKTYFGIRGLRDIEELRNLLDETLNQIPQNKDG